MRAGKQTPCPSRSHSRCTTPSLRCRHHSCDAELAHALRTKFVVFRPSHEGLELALIDHEEDLGTDLGTQESCFLRAVSAPRGASRTRAGAGSIAVRTTLELGVVFGEFGGLDDGGPLEVTGSVLLALVHARGARSSRDPWIVVRGSDQKGVQSVSSRVVLQAWLGLARAHLGGRVGSAGGERRGEGGWNFRGEDGGRGRVQELLRNRSEKSLVETCGMVS